MNKVVIALMLCAFVSACSKNSYEEDSSFLQTYNTPVSSESPMMAMGHQKMTEKTRLPEKKTEEVKKTSKKIAAKTMPGTGVYMDVLARKLRQELLSSGAQVKQMDNKVLVTLPNSVVFGSNDAKVSSKFEPVLTSVGRIISEYDKTTVSVIGYTDNTGMVSDNVEISLKRANEVSNFLRLRGVSLNRMTVDGFGPKNPIASNHTAEGRTQNRRVEITLTNLE